MKCQALTKAGFGCLHKAKKGLVMCGKHDLKEHGQCIGRNENGKRCAKIGPLCIKHQEEQTVINDARTAEMEWDRLMLRYDAGEVTVLQIRYSIDLATAARRLTAAWREELLQRLGVLIMEEGFFRNQQTALPFHADNQNVHREVVAEQTNRGMNILLAQEVPKEQETLEEIWGAWGRLEAVPEPLKGDMTRWYTQSSCRKDNDWLYKRALDGLWSMINTHKDKTELVERLADEADESLGMCCEGHLCRLVNVMVGFDERFETPVSKKEQLQQRMADIAAMDISTEQKALDAWKWMEDNGIAEEERSAWIDAF